MMLGRPGPGSLVCSRAASARACPPRKGGPRKRRRRAGGSRSPQPAHMLPRAVAQPANGVTRPACARVLAVSAALRLGAGSVGREWRFSTQDTAHGHHRRTNSLGVPHARHAPCGVKPSQCRGLLAVRCARTAWRAARRGCRPPDAHRAPRARRPAPAPAEPPPSPHLLLAGANDLELHWCDVCHKRKQQHGLQAPAASTASSEDRPNALHARLTASKARQTY